MGSLRFEEVWAMTWDLGLAGIALLGAMSLGFGLATQVVGGRAATRWLWLNAWAIYFVGGLFTSEVWFGWADEEELQPNIDGLSFDEVLLFMFLSGALVTFGSRYLARRRRNRLEEITRGSGSTRPTSRTR